MRAAAIVQSACARHPFLLADSVCICVFFVRGCVALVLCFCSARPFRLVREREIIYGSGNGERNCDEARTGGGKKKGHLPAPPTGSSS